MSPSAPLEPCALESRQSQESSVFQSPHFGLHQPALAVRRRDVAHDAERALPHQSAGFLNGAGVAVGEVDHVDELALTGLLHHRVGVPRIERQRLFAENVFAGLEERHCGREMRGIGRHIDHRVELAPGDGLVDCRKLVLDAILLAEAIEALLIGVNGGNHLAALVRPERLSMRIGHQAGAENEDAFLFRCHVSPRSVRSSAAAMFAHLVTGDKWTWQRQE